MQALKLHIVIPLTSKFKTKFTIRHSPGDIFIIHVITGTLGIVESNLGCFYELI